MQGEFEVLSYVVLTAAQQYASLAKNKSIM